MTRLSWTKTTLRSLVAAGTLLAGVVPSQVAGQAEQLLERDAAATLELPAETNIGFARGSFIVAPIPFESPELDTGLALGGAYLFQADEGSSKSSIGLGGFRTKNDSRGVGGGANLSFSNNRWQATIFAADAEVLYDFFINSVPFPIEQSGQALRADLKYGFTPQISAGIGFQYLDTTVAPNFRFLNFLPPELQPDASLEIFKLGLLFDWDRRDDNFYPSTGTLVSASSFRGTMRDLDDRVYEKHVISAAGYRSIFGDGVIAGRVVGCAASDDAPFFDSCAIGPTDGFRGFPATEFLDNALFSVQAEYRGRLSKRLGYVVFGGAGSVAEDFSDALGGSYQLAGGLGARIRLSRKFPVDYAIDVSFAEDGAQLLYLSVGQRW
ncbi:MAG: hypothetical protein AAGF74_02485 [Pseudomonadota bacterium]